MSSAPRSRGLVVAIGLLLLWSLLIRVWFATDQPSGSRFWDERYGLENIRPLVLEGRLKPANGFHPSLSYLPQAAIFAVSHQIYEATGNEDFRIFKPPSATVRQQENPETPGRRWPRVQFYTSTAYLLARYLQTIFGLASLLVAFKIGRTIFSDWAALLGTALLAGTFWHLRQSIIFKPDILLILLTLVVMDRTLAALRDPTLRRYLTTGLAIGLALATKFNAGPIAVPLILATFLHRRLGRAVWLRLAAAGLLALAVFLILNPFILTDPGLYGQDFGRTLEDYANKGRRAESSRLFVLWHGLLSLLTPNFHGWLFGALGAAALFAAPWLPGLEPRHRQQHGLVLSYVLAYSLLYAASTTNPSPHNWLLLSPWIALYGGALFHALWDRGRKWLPALASPSAVVVLLLGFTLASQWHASRLVYELVVPNAAEALALRLRRDFGMVDQRLVVAEPTETRFLIRKGRAETSSTLLVDRIAETEADFLDRADAAIFPAYRLRQSPDREFLESRLSSFPASRLEIATARPFVARGESVAAIVHPWTPVGRKQKLAELTPGGSSWTTTIPATTSEGRWITFEIRPPRHTTLKRIRIGDREIPTTTVGGKHIVRTIRIRAPEPDVAIHFDLEVAKGRKFDPERPVRLWMRRWSAPK